eukprot:gene14272-16846_t
MDELLEKQQQKLDSSNSQSLADPDDVEKNTSGWYNRQLTKEDQKEISKKHHHRFGRDREHHGEPEVDVEERYVAPPLTEQQKRALAEEPYIESPLVMRQARGGTGYEGEKIIAAKRKPIDYYGLQALTMKENNPNVPDTEIISRIRKWQIEASKFLDSKDDRLNKDLEELLVTETYFNANEVNILYKEFIKQSHGKLYMTKSEFISNFTPFSESDSLTDSLLRAIDERLKIKEGFLIIYQRNIYGQFKKPSRVIFLPGATVKIMLDVQKRRKFSKEFQSLHGFELTSPEYHRYFLMPNKEEANQWVNAIRHFSRRGYRFESFAQPRNFNSCQWFINGSSYYAELAKSISKARHEIFITGWWVWPYVILDRSSPADLINTRLDRLLTERAKAGVKVYILMWNETNLGIQLGTKHSMRWFQSCHPNISVIRHPRMYPLSWSHHQKCVVIDQTIAFVGGVDICFMRYELDTFPLTDLDGHSFPGRDYGNLNSVVTRTGNPHHDQIDRNELPRMPWHDVHMKVVGPSAKDAGYNFIQRWNHAISVDSRNRGKSFLLPRNYKREEAQGDITNKPNRVKNIYSNIRRNVGHLSGYGQSQQTTFHRPGDNPVVRAPILNQARKFNNSIDTSIEQGVSFDQMNSDYDHSPEAGGHLASSSNDNNQDTELNNDNEASSSSIHDHNVEANDQNCLVQIVRSGCLWSVGSDVEDSCYKAYINTIRRAKNFIYIQNLFFISSCGSKLPKNRIALALLQKVRHAIQNKRDFKIVVVTSINPGGDVNEPSARTIIGWTQRTIHRGGQSIYELLQREFPEVDLRKYIGFFSLRKWESCFDRIYTEQIYVHSKVLIADDRTAIIGSCNINDRSMCGTRDSEIAAVVTDNKLIDSRMGGRRVQVGTFSHTLRMGLWRIHLGITDDSLIEDPHQAYDTIWRNTAANNTRIFREAFGEDIPENQRVIPDSSLFVKRYFPKTDQRLELLQQTKGFIINYPEHMYEESDLFTSNLFTPERYVDVSVFI